MHVETLLFLTKPNVLPVCETKKTTKLSKLYWTKYTSKNSPGKTLGFHYTLKSTDINTNGGKPLVFYTWVAPLRPSADIPHVGTQKDTYG